MVLRASSAITKDRCDKLAAELRLLPPASSSRRGRCACYIRKLSRTGWLQDPVARDAGRRGNVAYV